MDYGQIYYDLIERALRRTLTQDIYIEKHHIWPKCLGGLDEKGNLVKLTAEEHFLAHQLLVKMFPNNKGLVFACHAMCMDKNGNRVNNKMYGWLKRKCSEASKTRIGPNTGNKHSEVTRLKMSNSHKGKTISKEIRLKQSQNMKGKKLSPETIAKRQATRMANGGYNWSLETNAKRSSSKKKN